MTTMSTAASSTQSNGPVTGQQTPAHADRFRRPVTEADTVLAARVRAGDRDAFAALYRSTVQRVTAFVTARVHRRDLDLVDDLVQDAYCLALTEPYRVDPDLIGSMYALAARAMTNHNWSQRRYLRAAHTLYTDRTTAATNDPTTAPADRRTIAAISRHTTGSGWFAHALAQLTPDQRRVVQLRFLDGHSRTEAANRMGCTAGAVRSLEHHALRSLHALGTATAGAA
ncbi:RNA polymerase sigma factor [Dactylosporangium matsuzakiense]|uniref:DNA-directed RNA polymerase sigma-70 factor n=1 Tax=Dactylosporangium matsuzakiense TaxID=53360 RepID=A0A9W6KM75_9ACTN|nr:RNA polymerase sigma factor [Dactylosporangium matsuzakiense]UWZ44657.1 RNA polymerase sigma factor [Dactylosporangium matsuzakiense]GLL04667.1 DNA-directed RNA polymerase sigma-70 factor [Dactylosporangium matsuzakiense]